MPVIEITAGNRLVHKRRFQSAIEFDRYVRELKARWKDVFTVPSAENLMIHKTPERHPLDR